MELVLGAMNILSPIPDNPEANATIRGSDSSLITENRYIATVQQHKPTKAGIVVPILSAILPLIGPTIIRVTELGNRYSAAKPVLIPTTETKKKGIRKKVLVPAMKAKNRAEDPTENNILLNKDNGSIGNGARRSHTMNIENKTTVSTNPTIIVPENQPNF